MEDPTVLIKGHQYNTDLRLWCRLQGMKLVKCTNTHIHVHTTCTHMYMYRHVYIHMYM